MPNANMNGQVGYTKPGVNYPGYINVTREDEKITVTIRQDARPDGHEGPMATLALSFAEWTDFLRQIIYDKRI